MKIALPVVNGRLNLHFGHCQSFALVTVDENKTVTNTEFVDAPPHEPGLLPKWLKERKVTQVIAGGMGQRAQQLFVTAGISVLVGAPSEEPMFLVTAFLKGELKSEANACDH